MPGVATPALSRAKPQKENPEPASDASLPPKSRGDQAPSALPRKRRTVIGLVLLMIALGVGAMTAAYYWPEDLLVKWFS
jgi:hypothetical protein